MLWQEVAKNRNFLTFFPSYSTRNYPLENRERKEVVK